MSEREKLGRTRFQCRTSPYCNLQDRAHIHDGDGAVIFVADEEAADRYMAAQRDVSSNVRVHVELACSATFPGRKGEVEFEDGLLILCESAEDALRAAKIPGAVVGSWHFITADTEPDE